MAFDDYELSAHSGSPVQLYEFKRTSDGTDYFWRYNSSDRDLTYGGGGPIYTALPISDAGISFSGEAASTEFIVTMPITAEFCDMFRNEGTVPSDTVWLYLRRVHAGDIGGIDGDTPTVNPTETRLTWIGTVEGLTQLDDISAKITCSTLAASFRRGGLRYGYMHNCPHMLYGAQCTKDRADFEVEVTLTDVDGQQIQGTEFGDFDDGWFNGGFIEYPLDSGMVERRMIVTHAGTTCVLLGFPAELVSGAVITALPGCNRTISICESKFDNVVNFGGFPHIPGRNPFDGMPVF